MPLKWFICDKFQGKPVPLEECFKCHQCMTEPTLRLISQDREWNGEPSTTQLLNGTMMEFLKITRDYGVNPQSRAFSIHGTKVHGELQKYAEELGLPAEIAMSPDGRDIFDLLEYNSTNSWTLTDYKTWGSYRVVRALGITKVGKGKDAEFLVKPEDADLSNEELQLNNYRIKLEKLGIIINNMQLQVMVRDGGLSVAATRGIDFNIRLIPIKRLPDDEVLAYFAAKRQRLLNALADYKKDNNYFPEVCNSEESWEGRRCQSYCDVAEFCPKGIVEKGGIA